MQRTQLSSLAAFILAGLAVTAAGRARAQERWVVLGATARPDQLHRVLEAAERAAPPLEAIGAVVLSQERSVALIEAELSAPFRQVPDALRTQLAETAEAALEDVVFTRNQRAIDRVERILTAIEP